MKVGIQMSLLRRNNDIEFYAVPNQHWVISAEYPFYKDLEKLLTNLDRQFLHAKTLGFFHPRKKKEMIFTAILPSKLNNILKMLRNTDK